MNKDIVALEGMEFYAFHGFYEEEREKGNHFVVDAALTTSFDQAADTDELSGTVNYEELHSLVQKEMEIPSKLLEHVAGRIINKCFESFPHVTEVKVSVAKKNPPIKAKIEQSKITMVRAR
ncbi:dihydroneopterin aldolase [Roseivirga sp.]|uniref:dihydroneopterin aldolase n=1 Tax=Roseivirga sp. TaxID=1964215 RepID=UPI003B51945A